MGNVRDLAQLRSMVFESLATLDGMPEDVSVRIARDFSAVFVIFSEIVGERSYSCMEAISGHTLAMRDSRAYLRFTLERQVEAFCLGLRRELSRTTPEPSPPPA